MPRKPLPTLDEVRRLLADDQPLEVPEVVVVTRRSEYGVRLAIANGDLPSYRLGKRIRVPASAVKALLGER